MRAEDPTFQANWRNLDRVILRNHVAKRLTKFSLNHNKHACKFAWVWHGTDPTIVNKIGNTGFAALGTTDSGKNTSFFFDWQNHFPNCHQDSLVMAFTVLLKPNTLDRCIHTEIV
jgi:hypothetical protein